VTNELGKTIQNFDGLGLKITVLYFLACHRHCETDLSAISDSVKKFEALLVTAAKFLSVVIDRLKIFYHLRRQRLKK
jgi:hypothetical protein